MKTWWRLGLLLGLLIAKGVLAVCWGVDCAARVQHVYVYNMCRVVKRERDGYAMG